MKSRSSVFFATILLHAFGCHTSPPDRSEWSGALTLHSGTLLPFHMTLDLTGPAPSGFFTVGDERTQIPECRTTSDSIILEFSEYGASLRGRWDGSRLSGSYFRYRSDTTSIPFFAAPLGSEAYARTASSPPGVALVGTFQAYLQGSSTVDSSTTGVFWSRADSVFGTLIAPDGDYGLFAGVQRGDSAYLGRFTGWQVLKLELGRTGASWSGRLFVRGGSPTPFQLEPRPTAEPEATPDKITAAADPKAKFRFSGLTTEGMFLTETSSKFKDKALIVDIMGTWCHNCMDAVPILQQLSKEYGPKGLEVVGLSFEISDDTSLAKRNIELFARRHGVTYPLLFCGSTEPVYTDPQLKSQLKNFYAYPTTLFIDRSRRIRSVHVGFRGPGTGDAYQREIETLYRHAEEIVK
ncbi:MAG TPA: hypothetical protein DCX46_08655 [Bacteroidetes bacterium]|nr:hypothetical protein [Bacteroidota bacterium]